MKIVGHYGEGVLEAIPDERHMGLIRRVQAIKTEPTNPA